MMTDKPTTKNSDNSAEKANTITKSTQKSAESPSSKGSEGNVTVNMSNSTNAIKNNTSEKAQDNNKNQDKKSQADKPAQKTETAKATPQSASSAKVKQTMKPEPKKAQKKEPIKEPAQKSKISKLAILALLIAIIAVVGVVLLYFWHIQQQNTLISQLQQVKTEATKSNRLAQKNILKTLEAQEQNLAMSFEDSVNDMKQETQENIEQLNLMVERFSQNQPTDWLVHEAEYLIRVAARTLWLEKDTTAAIGLLQDADARIAELNDPEILPIRQLIYQDIEALRLMPKLETEQVILSLMALNEQVQSLPLVALVVAQEVENKDRYTLSEDVSDWRENIAKTWDKFLQTFVVVHSKVGDLEPILPAEQRQHLKENLSLKLQIAQWAASKGNHDLFVKSLNDAELWLTQYFDLNDEKNKVFVNSIESVKNKVIVVEDELKLVSLKAIRKALKEKKSTRLPMPEKPNNVPLEAVEEVEQVIDETLNTLEPETNEEVLPQSEAEATPEVPQVNEEQLKEDVLKTPENNTEQPSEKAADMSEAA